MSKQVIVIRKDLKLRRGKEIAQGSHASMIWLSKRFRDLVGIYLAIFFALGVLYGNVAMYINKPIVVLISFAVELAILLSLLTPSICYLIFFNKSQREWLLGSFAKVCLQIESEEELKEIYKKAKEKGLVAEQVIDSGKTEFHGVPTLTAVAIGPAENEKIDEITSHLKLY